MHTKKSILTLLLIGALSPCVIAQTRLTYANNTAPVIDWPTDLLWVGPEIVYGYGERFDLPVNPGTIDSVDFVVDNMGSDSIVLELLKDTILLYSTVYEHVPNLKSDPFAKITVYKKSIIPGSRTHVSLARTVVPDSFFVVVINDSNVVNEYRGYQTPPVNLSLFRSVFLAVDTEYGSGDFTGYLDRAFQDDIGNALYAEMDVGVTYEGTDGVQVHLSPSTSAAIAFPNPVPAGNPVLVSGAGPFVSAEIIDDAGRIVRTLHKGAGESTTQLSSQGLSPGVYNAILFHSDGSTTSVKFVIE